MKIWIHQNGVQEGPFDEQSLPLDRMDLSTPVWYEGLPYWMPASKAPLTAQLIAARFAQPQQPQTDYDIKSPQPEPPMQPVRPVHSFEPAQHAQQMPSEQAPRKCPPTYMVWSVLLTVLCCNVIGIIPIITGSTVTSKYNNYDYDGAQRRSETTAWWLMITIVTSLMLLPLSIIASL